MNRLLPLIASIVLLSCSSPEKKDVQAETILDTTSLGVTGKRIVGQVDSTYAIIGINRADTAYYLPMLSGHANTILEPPVFEPINRKNHSPTPQKNYVDTSYNILSMSLTLSRSGYDSIINITSDTTKAIMLGSDTNNRREVFWIRGYVAYSSFILTYLDSLKKPLPENIVIWSTKQENHTYLIAQ